jgi:hypothetical protein
LRLAHSVSLRFSHLMLGLSFLSELDKFQKKTICYLLFLAVILNCICFLCWLLIFLVFYEFFLSFREHRNLERLFRIRENAYHILFLFLLTFLIFLAKSTAIHLWLCFFLFKLIFSFCYNKLNRLLTSKIWRNMIKNGRK